MSLILIHEHAYQIVGSDFKMKSILIAFFLICIFSKNFGLSIFQKEFGNKLHPCKPGFNMPNTCTIPGRPHYLISNTYIDLTSLKDPKNLGVFKNQTNPFLIIQYVYSRISDTYVI